MRNILSATSRGQITLPKSWRDQFDTRYFQIEVNGDQIVLTPIIEKKNAFEESLENAWQEYEEEKVISQEAMIKKYAL